MSKVRASDNRRRAPRGASGSAPRMLKDCATSASPFVAGGPSTFIVGCPDASLEGTKETRDEYEFAHYGW